MWGEREKGFLLCEESFLFSLGFLINIVAQTLGQRSSAVGVAGLPEGSPSRAEERVGLHVIAYLNHLASKC